MHFLQYWFYEKCKINHIFRTIWVTKQREIKSIKFANRTTFHNFSQKITIFSDLNNKHLAKVSV